MTVKRIYNNDIPADHAYLTAGKLYEVIEERHGGLLYVFLDDLGIETCSFPTASAHLNGGDWQHE